MRQKHRSRCSRRWQCWLRRRRLRHQLREHAAELNHFDALLKLSLVLLHGHLGCLLLVRQLLLVADLLVTVNLLHVQRLLVESLGLLLFELKKTLLSMLVSLMLLGPLLALQMVDQLLLLLQLLGQLRVVDLRLSLLLLGDDEMLPLQVLVLVLEVRTLLDHVRLVLPLSGDKLFLLMELLRLELPELALVLLGQLGVAEVLKLIGGLMLHLKLGLLHHLVELVLLVRCRARRCSSCLNL